MTRCAAHEPPLLAGLAACVAGAAVVSTPAFRASSTGYALKSAWFGWRCRRAAQALEPAPASEVIVCFGDSFTAGDGVARDEAYPARLAELLGRPVQNLGRGGQRDPGRAAPHARRSAAACVRPPWCCSSA